MHQETAKLQTAIDFAETMSPLTSHTIERTGDLTKRDDWNIQVKKGCCSSVLAHTATCLTRGCCSSTVTETAKALARCRRILDFLNQMSNVPETRWQISWKGENPSLQQMRDVVANILREENKRDFVSESVQFLTEIYISTYVSTGDAAHAKETVARYRQCLEDIIPLGSDEEFCMDEGIVVGFQDGTYVHGGMGDTVEWQRRRGLALAELGNLHANLGKCLENCAYDSSLQHICAKYIISTAADELARDSGNKWLQCWLDCCRLGIEADFEQD